MEDTDILIEHATSSSDMKEVSPLRWEVERFIFDLGIKAMRGKPVPAFMIYFHYINWKLKNKEANILSRRGFFKEFRHYFHRYIDSGGRVYSIDGSVFDLSDKAIKEAKHLFKEERKWQKKSKVVKEGQKKRRQVLRETKKRPQV